MPALRDPNQVADLTNRIPAGTPYQTPGSCLRRIPRKVALPNSGLDALRTEGDRLGAGTAQRWLVPITT